MWTRFCLRVLSASFCLKPLAEASSWRSVPLVNLTSATGPFSSQEQAASGTRGSVISWTSEVGGYTSAHQSTRVSTSRWLSPSDAHTNSWIGAAGSVTAVCSGSGDSGSCLLSAATQPIATASPPAFSSESATLSSATNGSPEILTETAAQVDSAAALSASPALSIIPADPSITSSDFAAESLYYPLPNHQPPPIEPAGPSAPSFFPVTPGRPTRPSDSFPIVNSTGLATTSSPRISLSSTPPVDQSPPVPPAPLSIASTATLSRFASQSTVKTAAEASTTNGSGFSTSLTAPVTFSFPPYASALSPTAPGNGVATSSRNCSASSKYSNTTLAAATTLVISQSMALSFYTGPPAFPTALTSGPLASPPAPTLPSTMPDNTILPSATGSSSQAFSPDSDSIFVCGGNPFKPSEYTCYDESTLCPVDNGVRLEACGGSCFNPGSYGCVDNGLQPIVSGTLPGGVTPSRTTGIPVTQWPSSVPTPRLSATSTASSKISATTTSSSSTLLTSVTSSSSFSTTSSSSTSSSKTSSSTSSSSSSSSASASASASVSSSSSSTAAPNPSNDDNLSTNQIAAIAASTSAAVVLFVVAALLLFRRHQRKRATPAQQVYPELAYLYDPPVPGSGNASRSALGGPNSNPSGSGGAVGPFGVGGPAGAQPAGVSDGARNAGAGNAAGWTGATLSALGASLRGGGRSGSQHSTSSNGSAVSLVGPAGRPPVMGAAGGSNASGSGSSNAALLTGRSGSGTPTRGAGDGNTLAPAPSRTDEGTGEESRPFLAVTGAAGSSQSSSRDRSVERGAGGAPAQQQGRDEVGLWDEIDRDSAEREHERQIEETRQRRELARAFLLQAKERQEQRIPLLNRGGAESGPSGTAAAAGIGGVALAGAAAAASSRGQQRQSNPKAQRTQQWWQSSPSGSPPPGSPSPPAATHANTYTPAYHPIYPPISPTFPASGPILTSQHIEHNRLQQAQHAHAAARAVSPTYPSFHSPHPSYPPPSWPQAQQNTYNQLNNSSTNGYTSGGYSPASTSAYSTSAGGRPFFHQNTSYNPPHRSYSNSTNNGAYSSYNQYGSAGSSNGGGQHRRGSSGSIHNTNVVGGVYTTIPEEEPPQHHHQQHGKQQSLSQIMSQMNALDEEDSADEGQGFLQAPRRVLSVRNGAVTPSSDGDESTDERDGGTRRRVNMF